MRIHKYVVFLLGTAFGVAVAATTAIIAADDTVPYTFKPGEVISAGVMNDLFSRINNTNRPMSYRQIWCTRVDQAATLLGG